MLKSTLYFLLGCLIFLPEYGFCSIFSYKDTNGTIHYTNVSADSRSRLKKSAAYNVSANQKSWNTHLRRLRAGYSRGTKTLTEPILSTVLLKHIRHAAQRHQVDPHLIKAIIKAESNFNHLAVSSQGAQGLMQLMPATARELQVRNAFDIRQNIEGGTRYFKKLLKAYGGNIKLSLAAYNAGPGRVKRHGRIPEIPETKRYVNKVMRHYASYRSGLDQSNSINIRRIVTVR